MPRRAWPTVVALVAVASVGHVVYPAFLAIATRWRGRPPAPAPAGRLMPWPAVTVVVPAFREAGVISTKVKDVLANDYPGPIDVLVVCDGDPVTADRARAAGARVLCPPERLGKAQALNVAFESVTDPVVVITDANNRIAPGSIAAMVRHFEDPEVGAVAGEKEEADGDGEGLYWRFESWLKRHEWQLGTTIGLVFFLILVTIVPFGIGPDRQLLARIGPSILWIAALLAMLLGLDRLFQADDEDGSLDLEARLRSFDEATARQEPRDRAGRRARRSGRGWTREELYDRARPR